MFLLILKIPNYCVLLTLFTYKTPLKFAGDFKTFYGIANLKQVKILSMTIFAIAATSRIIGLFNYNEVIKITNYQEHSLGNWIQIIGATCFYFISKWALKRRNLNIKLLKTIVLTFTVFILLTSMGVSYVVSLHNTKNTLTVFLIGIVTVSLFFAVEYKEIILITCLVIIAFTLSMVLPKISFNDKIMNILASVIFGFILISFSRYSYYFKSQHFVRLRQLEEKTIEIERLNTQKSEILAFVAHDLRGPLNNIEMLSMFLTAETPESTEIKMIATAAKQAKAIINDLVEAVRVNEPLLKTESVEISAFLETFINKWKLNTTREICLKSFIKEHVNINTSRLERALDNLVSNALKFSLADKPIEIELLKHNDKVCIVVSDYGIGIPEDLQKAVFNQFSTSGRKGLNGEKSLGLGLHIAKRIVEQHKGKLLMNSKEHQGTTFTIILPLA